MSSCSLLARDQILSKPAIDFLSCLEHLEIRPSLNNAIDAAVTSRYLQSPAARPVPQRGNVEVGRRLSRVSRESRENRNVSVLNVRGESEELSLSRLQERELLLPRS